MKNAIIIGALVVIGAAGIILGLNGYDVADAGDFGFLRPQLEPEY